MGINSLLASSVGVGALYASFWCVFYGSTQGIGGGLSTSLLLAMYLSQLAVYAFFGARRTPLGVGAVAASGLVGSAAVAALVLGNSGEVAGASAIRCCCAAAFGVQRALAVVGWCRLMSRFSYAQIQTGASAAIGSGAAFTLICLAAGGPATRAAAIAAPAASAFLYWRVDKGMAPLYAANSGVPCRPLDGAPRSFLASACVLSVANGYLRGAGAFDTSRGTVLIFSAVALCCLLMPMARSLKSVYTLTIVLMAGGMMFSPFDSMGFSLVGIGEVCFTMMAWVVCAALQKRDGAQTSTVCGTVWFALITGQCAGILLGLLVRGASDARLQALAPIALAFCVVLVFALTLNEPFLYTAGSGSGGAETRSAFDSRLVAIERRCGLTPRETAVFELLAYGRDSTYIEKELGISPNTVKTHVRNIYGKLGVSGRQELISLVEAEPAPGAGGRG